MAVVEGVPIEEMLNRSFYKVFSNGDKKWLVAYADVALNGTKHTLHDYSPEINKNLIIHCYQLLSARIRLLCLCAASDGAINQREKHHGNRCAS